MMKVRTEDFEAYFGSWAGCDGGNPQGIWICGIEYGGDIADVEDAIRHYKRNELYSKIPGGWNSGRRERYLSLRYHQNVAKLMLALRSLNAGGIEGMCAMKNYHEYMRKELYSRDGETFKLNLYPFPSPSLRSQKWNDAYGSIPILSSKGDYYARCRGMRFPFMASQRRVLRPRLIIGTGKSMKGDFAQAFGFNEDGSSLVTLESKGAKRDCYLYQDGESSLLVTPFFGGRYGLNSYELLFELARIIHQKNLLGR